MTEKTALEKNETHNRNDSPAGGLSDAAGTSKDVQWDQTGVVSIFPNSFEVRFSREEVALILGTKQSGDDNQDGFMIRLLSQIAMSPHTAKRLKAALETVIREYESRYGTSETEGIPKNISGKSEEKRNKKESDLLEAVKSLEVEMGYERSFKISMHSFDQNRFLLGTSKNALGEWAHPKIIDLCFKLGMPDRFLTVLKNNLDDANYVHFGFERNETTCLYKVYLEFWHEIKKGIDSNKYPHGPVLLHLGLKWDAFNSDRQSLTHYRWHPWISTGEIRQRVANILASAQESSIRQAVEQLITLASSRIPDRDILYLEVTEEDNPRRSFDLNVYRANLQVSEVYPLLSVLCRCHSVPFDKVHLLYNGIKTKRFGHLAAGVDRDGKSFFTIYYGVQGAFGDSSREALPRDEIGSVSAKSGRPTRKPRINHIEEVDDKAGRLYQLLNELGRGVRLASERSWKFQKKNLLADRVLLGFRRPSTTPNLDGAILSVCRQLDMPEEYREMFREKLSGANIVLFGFEKNENIRLFKAYLEFGENLIQAINQDPMPESVVIHNGFKWDASDNSRKVFAQYTAYFIPQANEIATRILKNIYRNEKRSSFLVVDDILDLVGSRTRPGELLYCEVSEDNNLRKSFDVNTYRANLQMAEIYPMLVETARCYDITFEQFAGLYEPVKDYKFGHVSGGLDREGRDFLTVYFYPKGEEPAEHFADAESDIPASEPLFGGLTE